MITYTNLIIYGRKRQIFLLANGTIGFDPILDGVLALLLKQHIF